MKKLIWLTLTLLYLFTSSSLVHASTMWFFDVSHNSNHTITHCHTDTWPTSDKQPEQNMGCCELFSSNQHSQIRLDLTDSIKLFQHHDNQIQAIYNIQTSPQLVFKRPIIFSPWWQTSWWKYHKFSDLFGIIVQLS